MTQPRSLRHPGRWLWIFLAIPVAIGLFRLKFDVEVFDLLPDSIEAVKGLKLYQQHFSNARELVITVEAENPDEAEAAAHDVADALRKSPLVSSVTWEPPWIEHPEQSGELLGFLWLNQPPSAFNELTNRLAPAKLDDVLANTREQLTSSLSPDQIGRLSYDPFGLTRLPEEASSAAPDFAQGNSMFASADGTFRMIFVEASHDLNTYKQCDDWLKAIEPMSQSASRQARDRKVMLHFTGRPAFVAEVALGMQHDVHVSVGGTAAIIAILFWLAHRRVKPMLWLLTLLAVILGSTLALGGLIYGTINVVSMGFAAILLGLAVDYAVVHYQEALAQPELTIPEVRSAIAPAIFWAAITTISAFLVLNFGGLPGLGQLGTLVGLGVALSACIMIFEFLPPLFPQRRGERTAPAGKPVREGHCEDLHSAQPSGSVRIEHPNTESSAPFNLPRISRVRALSVFVVSAILILFTIGVLGIVGRPSVDPTANALRPRGSAAYEAMDRIQKSVSKEQDPLWVIVRGNSESEVGQRLKQIDVSLKEAVSDHWISSFNLPTPLWPRPEFQHANRAAAAALIAERPLFLRVAESNGFTQTSMALAGRILDAMKAAQSVQGTFWPTNPMSEWIFHKFASHTATNFYSVGMITPLSGTGPEKKSGVEHLHEILPHEDTWLSGWELLGGSIFARVKANMWKVLSPMLFLVMLSLWLAFRRPREILLSLAVLAISAAVLLSVMRLAGWSWNLLNLMAVPLILGTGVDYSIFMQLALRRHQGDLRMAYLAVGRALLLCGATAVAAFGSLALSTNAGMSSLGKVCAVGIGSNMLIAIYLLPMWWRATFPNRGERDKSLDAPSSLYHARLWRAGLFLVRVVPVSLLTLVARSVAAMYWIFARHRRDILIENLLPAVNGDRSAAEIKARALMRNFAIKLVDLFRYEAGKNIDDLFGNSAGWEVLQNAQKSGRGVLVLTCHLGNWELGGPWLTRKGMRLQVITLSEPGDDFTELRQKSRSKWNIDTLVIGNDPFAIVDVIRRLENGAIVALLIDRPPSGSAIDVELFGKRFNASVAAAELARASGCALVPVYLPRRESDYDGRVLPEITYDRAALRDRAATRQLTQKIMAVFEPIIREHADQWYHFVPVWPQNKPEQKDSRQGIRI
jgi:predicted RND superfamily exporter protein